MNNSKRLRVGIVGATGRVGKELLQLAKSSKKIVIAEKLDFRKTVPKKINVDVVIDFSQPAGLVQAAQWCAMSRVPLISGTTGYSASDLKKIKSYAKKTAILLSPNMSVAVNAMADLLATAVRVLEPTKVHIEETHHIHKKDKPSGTAKFLASAVEGAKNSKTKILPIKSIRRGEVFGIHKVTLTLGSEQIVLEHEAKSRAIFAQGAIEAATWISNKKPGFYKMDEMIKARGGKSNK